MNLHEYQAKQLLASYGLPVSKGEVASNVEEALQIASRLNTKRWVVKAQVHAGGRGKAGGVKLVATKDEVADVARSLLGKNLVTYQTTAEGQPVNQVLIEEPCDIAKELYLGAVIDRSKQRIVFMASTEGGVEIEKVAEETPEKIIKVWIDPCAGLLSYQAREIAFGLGLEGNLFKDFIKFIDTLYKAYNELDATLIEINPLVITEDERVLVLDAKITLDDNAFFRHKDYMELRDENEEDPLELEASKFNLNYIKLDGNVGCMVNGAGLAMATMDLIKLAGGSPANFLDVGGTATPDTVENGFRIILSDKNVKAILINIFGGIVRCDRVANGIIQAARNIDISVPVVVRLQGTNAEEAKKLLDESGLNLIAATTLEDAAEKVTEAIF